MRIDILTLFPEMFEGVLGSSILKRAADPYLEVAENLTAPRVAYHLTNIRDHTNDKHRKVDQAPYGGGPGMVFQCQPVWDAVMAVEAEDPIPATRIFMTPQGARFDQSMAEQLVTHPRLLIIAGHYEGIDERVVEKLNPITEISIGDFVLSGGEVAAMALIDAVVRLIPGVLGDAESAHQESFSRHSGRKLDYPHFTRPATWMGISVPPVLLSGNHAAIETWRRDQAQSRTKQRRPDLIQDDPEPS